MKSNKKVILAIMLVILSLLTFSVLVSCTATVEYKLDFIVDGEVYHTINTAGETIIAMPQNPTKEGYTFDGWYWDDNAWKKPFTANSLLEAPLSSDMKVFAKFTEQNEELTGLGIRAKGFTKQETVLNTSVRNSVDSFNFNDYIEVKNDSKWTVCLDMMCKDIIPSKMILLEPGENIIYILVTDSSENICVYTVKIYRNKMITINFENNFENTIDSFEIEEGQPIGDIVEPRKTGYEFVKWTNNNEDINKSTIIDADVEYCLRAEYVAKKYNIIYMDGSKELFRTTYSIEENVDLTTKVPVKEGYTFDKWYTSIDGIEIKESIDLGSTGDITLYANYIHNGYINKSRATEIIIPEKMNGEKITSIEREEFRLCTSLTSITIPSSVTSIGNYAFDECYSLVRVNISDIESWLNISFGYSSANPIYYGAKLYINNEELTTIEIPNTITEIKREVFYGYSSLTSITFEENSQLTSIGERAFSGCRSLANIEIPSSVTSIGGNAFSGCRSLANIEIPSSVTSIEYGAFFGCSSLTSITIPSSVTSIDGNAFSGCDSLTSIVVNPNNTVYDSRNNCNAIIKTSTNTLLLGCQNTTIPNTVTSIGGDAFYGCSSLTSITIPSSVTNIGSWAFFGCSSLTSITIPSSVTSIVGNAFSRCDSLTSIVVNPNNTVYDSRNNCNAIIETSTNTLLLGCQNTTIPNTVTSIGYRAFYGCSSLTSIEIPSSVTSIEYGAFYGCSSLKRVNISTIESWLSISFDGSDANPLYYGAKLYINDEEVTTIEMPDTITEINSYAFYGCSSLTRIIFGENSQLTSIGYGAFEKCSNLQYNIYQGMKYFGTETNPYTFLVGITDMFQTSFIIHDETERIIKIFDFGNLSCASITIPSGVKYISEDAFDDWDEVLVEIYNKSNIDLTETDCLGNNIYGLDNVKNIYTGEGGSKLFTEGDFLVYKNGQENILIKYLGTNYRVVIPEGITAINCYAFAYAPVLMIEIPASINQTEIVLLGAHIFEARNKSAATIYIQTMEYEGPLKNVYTETEGESKIKTTTDYVYYEDNGEKILLKYLSSEEYIVVPNDISIVHIDTIKMLLLEMGMLSANEFPAIYVDENNIDAIIIELEFGIIPINEIFTLVESDKTGYKKYVLNLEN